jgi:prevent-host-death family protein
MVRKNKLPETVSIADAKAHLSELVSRAANGDTVCITRRGKPVAKLTAIDTPRKPIDLAMLRAVTEGKPTPTGSAAEFIRRFRDEERY